MAWEYTTIQQYETVDIKTLCRQTNVKWWKKFNNNLISKSKIDEWVNNNSKNTSQQNTMIMQTILNNADHSDAESSESNPYLHNGDMFD
ncbi:hypothetical protein CR513_08511, partial [Mucuna pruriens]